MVTNKRYEELANFYDREIDRITKDRDYWRDKFLQSAVHAAEVDVYKSILAKQGILGEPNTYSDKVFVFEGKIYRPTSHCLNMGLGCNTSLSVEFVRLEEK